MVRSLFLAVLLLAAIPTGPADAGEWDLSGNLSLETRVFPYHPAFADQDRTTVSPSVALQPELVFETESGNDRLTVQPFLRHDRDDPHRSHGDIRIANWLHQAETWDLAVGLDKVFWGVAESRHLVDIINQTDLVERADGEEKLGQPMVNLNVQSDFGSWSAFILPGFRQRTFPGRRSRLRGPLRVDTDNPVYQADLGDKHVDGAVRWSHSLSGFDVGVSHFYGTSREPRLVATVLGNGETVLVPHYDLIHQTGLDLQYTKEALLLKLESISRSGHANRFYAAIGGFEYTMFQIFESKSDLGLLAEYQYDGRDGATAPGAINDSDIFIGARWTLNDEKDTSLLAGALMDVRSGTRLFSFEAERRLTDTMKLELEGRFSFNVSAGDAASAFRDDDQVTLRLKYFF